MPRAKVRQSGAFVDLSPTLPAIPPDSRLFYDDATGAAADLSGRTPNIGPAWLGTMSPGGATQMRLNGSGRIAGPSGGGQRLQKLGLAKADDYYFHAKIWTNTGNPLRMWYGHSGANDGMFLEVGPSAINLGSYLSGGYSNWPGVGLSYSWVNGDDAGIVVQPFNGSNKLATIVINGIPVAGPYVVPTSGSNFGIGVSDDWGQQFDDIIIEAIPAYLLARLGMIRLDKNTQTGTAYTLAYSDFGKVVEMDNASANTLTVPQLSTGLIAPEGGVVTIRQKGAGQTTIAAGSGVTIRQRESKLKLAGQWAEASLIARGSNEYILSGDLTT